MVNIIKSPKNALEAKGDLALVDNRLGRISTGIADLEERTKELLEAKRKKCEREDAELKKIREEKAAMRDGLLEMIGARKMLVSIMTRTGIPSENEKYDRLLADVTKGRIIKGAMARLED